MKKRFNNWFKHIFIKYIPSSQFIAQNEAARFADYISKNYTLDEQLIITERLNECLISNRIYDIENTEFEAAVTATKLEDLKENLEKLSIK